jgi:NAD+-dependent protein deacetylase sirtuin 5
VPAFAHINTGLDLADGNVPLTDIPLADLPHCPKCNTLLRPGVTWFGEALPKEPLKRIDRWMGDEEDRLEPCDIVLMIGTSVRFSNIEHWCTVARDLGARLAVVNPDPEAVEQVGGLEQGDWFFQADAAEVLPELFRDT